MSTIRQVRLAEAIVENAHAIEPLNKQELVASVGYSEMSAEKKATEIISSKGTQDELKKLGFTEEGAKKVVEEILYDSRQEGATRLRAASEIFKVFGTYAAEKSFNLTATASVDEIKNVIQKDLARFRSNQ